MAAHATEPRHEEARTTESRDAGAIGVEPSAPGPVDRDTATGRPTAELIGDMSQQITRLVRDEVQLAMGEVRAKGKRLGLAGVLGGIAAVSALLGSMALVATVIIAISYVLPAWLSALIVGAALVIAAGIGAAALMFEVKRAKPPMPEEAIGSVREDIETVKGHLSS